MALALDGSVHGNSSSASSLGVSLTTSNADDVIVVVVTTNGGPITSVTATGLTFTLHAQYNSAGNSYIEIWTAAAASALSSKTITVATTSSAYLTIDAFGISGADTSTRFDANASVPDTGGTAPRTISTDTADTFIIGAFTKGDASLGSAGSGFTLLSKTHYQLVEYKIVSSTQSSLSVDITGTTASRAAATAVIIASSGHTSTGTQVLEGATQSASGGMAPAGSATQTLGALTQAASGAHSLTAIGTAAQALPATTQAGAATSVDGAEGTATQTLGALTQSGIGLMLPTAAAVQTLTAMMQAASGTMTANSVVDDTFYKMLLAQAGAV